MIDSLYESIFNHLNGIGFEKGLLTNADPGVLFK